MKKGPVELRADEEEGESKIKITNKIFGRLQHPKKRRDIWRIFFQTLEAFFPIRGRGDICHSRHCRWQCNIFANGVNFSIFTHLFVFLSAKLLKFGIINCDNLWPEIWRCKVFDKSHVWSIQRESAALRLEWHSTYIFGKNCRDVSREALQTAPPPTSP